MKTAFLTIFTLYLCSNIYLAYSLWQLMPINIILRIIVIAILVIGFAAPFIFFAFGESLSLSTSEVLYKAGTSWMIVFLYLFIFVLLIDIFKVSASLLHLVNKETLQAIFKHNAITSLILISTTALLLIMGNINYHNKRRVHIPISSSKIDKPMRIVAISDLHLGYTISKKELRKWVKMINKEKPDIVLIAGDLLDNQLRPVLAHSLHEELLKIEATSGVFACTGNHEYISGIKGSIDFFKKAGITLLRDSSVIANGVTIIGREDYSYKNRKELSQITQDINKKSFSILLDHQPNKLNNAVDEGIDLQISGHTHYGQVFPGTLVTKKLFELPHGYIQKEDTHIYVSSGLGIWGGKFRIGTQSEYVVIDLSNS